MVEFPDADGACVRVVHSVHELAVDALELPELAGSSSGRVELEFDVVDETDGEGNDEVVERVNQAKEEAF